MKLVGRKRAQHSSGNAGGYWSALNSAPPDWRCLCSCPHLLDVLTLEVCSVRQAIHHDSLDIRSNTR
jgi:hypothetical protein